MSARPFAAITDHVAVRVASIDEATTFYRRALGARILTDPFPVEGPLAEGIAGAPGARFTMRQIGFDRGVMELVELVGGPSTERLPAHALNILHIGVEVDDVPLAMERIRAAGGGIVVPLTAWGTAQLCFCTDLDGVVLELADAPIEDLLVHTRARSSSDLPGGSPIP